MPLTRSEVQKIGEAVAQQLAAVLGVKDEPSPEYEASQGPSLSEIEADFKAEVLPLIRDLVSDLKAGGHIPSGKSFADAVIVIA
jgi:hypothetical protein